MEWKSISISYENKTSHKLIVANSEIFENRISMRLKKKKIPEKFPKNGQ